MSAGKKKSQPAQRPVAHWQKAAQSIPFIHMFGVGNERNVLMALYKNPFAPPEQREYNPMTPPELRAELERYLENPTAAAAADQQELLKQAAKDFEAAEQRAAMVEQSLAPHRSGGKPGRKNKSAEAVRAHVRDLLKRYPALASSPDALFKHRDRDITGKLSPKRFGVYVREQRPKK
jgi:hypothetical protein